MLSGEQASNPWTDRQACFPHTVQEGVPDTFAHPLIMKRRSEGDGQKETVMRRWSEGDGHEETGSV